MDTDAYDATAVTADEVAVQANDLATAATAKAAAANQTGDNYVLVAVIMATVLFFAGMGTRFGARRVRRAMVAWAAVLLIGGLLFMLTQPISFGI
jgi:predicted phage tail protein